MWTMAIMIKMIISSKGKLQEQVDLVVCQALEDEMDSQEVVQVQLLD